MPLIDADEIQFSEPDFSTFIGERTRDFTGRKWVEAAIEGWLTDPGTPAYFILTGDPGVGKSAFAAHLVRSRPDQFAAYHFCSARLGGWIDPVAFVRSVSRQLSLRVDKFASKLLNREGVQINATQNIGHISNGRAVNVLIERLEISEPEDAYDRLVRAPLAALAASGSNDPIVILCDGLDEALAYSGSCTIVDLFSRSRDMPANIRFVLTSRAERRVLRYWDDIPNFRIHAAGEENLKDIREYVELRSREIPEFPSVEALEAIVARSAGNFLYVSHLMDTVSHDPRILDSPGDLPEGLDAVYRLFLNTREIGRDLVRWEERYQPVLGVLAVAREPLSEAALSQYTGLDRQRIASVMRDLWQYLSLEPGAERAYRIYHQSFIDFLLTMERSQDHWIDPQFWNERIARVYYPTGFLAPSLPSSWDLYAARHLCAHLADSGSFAALFALVEDRGWRRKKQEIDASGAAYAADVERAVLAASQSARSIAELFAYTLLFAAVTEPFTIESRDRLAAMVGEGRGQAALTQAGWIVRPADRSEAYFAIGRAFSQAGRAHEAAAAWDLALIAGNAEGNPIRAAEAMQVLCLTLFEQGEVERAGRVLEGAAGHISRIESDPLRLWQWVQLAKGLLGGGRKNDVKSVVDSLLSDLHLMRHRVFFHPGSDHEDPPYSSYRGVAAKCGAMEEAARLAMETSDGDWCTLVFSKLESLVATIPKEKWMEASWSSALQATAPEQHQPDSNEQANMRATLHHLRLDFNNRGTSHSSGNLSEPRNRGSEWRLPWRSSYGSEQQLVRPESKRDDALTCLEGFDLTRLGRLGLGEAAARQVAPTAGPFFDTVRIARRLESYVVGAYKKVGELLQKLENCPHPDDLNHVSHAIEEIGQEQGTWRPDFLAAWVLVGIGAYERALNVSNHWANNEDCADLWLMIAQSAVKSHREGALPLLERLVGLCDRLWAKEQTSRVLAGAACAFQELGELSRAWELVWDVEYQNIRVDAAIRLVWQAKQRGSPETTLDFCRRLQDLLETIWANGELARGLLVLVAAATWLGDGSLFGDARTRLWQVLNASPRLDRGSYRRFLMDARPDDEQRSHPSEFSFFASLQGEETIVEEAMAALVAAHRKETALHLFTRMQYLLDPLVAVKAMAVEALEKGDSDLYRLLVRLYFGLQEIGPEALRDHYPTNKTYLTLALGLASELPRKADLGQSFRWLRTALLAARFEGRDEVWRHTSYFVPLLGAFPAGTAERIRERLLAIEALHAGPESAEQFG